MASKKMRKTFGKNVETTIEKFQDFLEKGLTLTTLSLSIFKDFLNIRLKKIANLFTGL